MPLDIAMTVLSIVLMGGTVLFPDDRVHQILGMVLLALWIFHTALNRRWYGSLFRGSYRGYRIMQVAVNCALDLCALLVMVSGMMMAWFLPFDVGGALGFARTAHLLSSHWYYILMCLHLGMHVNVILARIRQRRAQKPAAGSAPKAKAGRAPAAGAKAGAADTSGAKTKACRLLVALAALYGAYAFWARGLWKYLFLQQLFFFFDFDRGYLLFALDYLAVLVLFAAVSHLLGKLLLRKKK